MSNLSAGRAFLILRTVLWGAGFGTVWALLIVGLRPLDARLQWSLPGWTLIPGVALVAAGATLALGCAAAFVVVGQGTPAPFDAPRRFVAVGPYRWVRNPMYLGGVAVLAGVGLILGSPIACCVAVLFLLLAHLFVVGYEEPTLESRFGAGYLEYKSLVARWLPRPPSGGQAPPGA